MIHHHIRKDLFQNVREAFGITTRPRAANDDIPAAVAAHVQQQNEHLPSVVDHVVPEQRSIAWAFLGEKRAYNEWLNSVMQKWKIGDTATLTIYPASPNRLSPPPLFEIHSFQEVRHLCQWDGFHQEPKAIGVMLGSGGFGYFCPKALRPLTDHEKFLVNLQHQQANQLETAGETPDDDGPNSRYTG